VKTEKEIKELIENIKKGEFIGKDNKTGLTRITEKGNDWIECLEWVIENA